MFNYPQNVELSAKCATVRKMWNCLQNVELSAKCRTVPKMRKCPQNVELSTKCGNVHQNVEFATNYTNHLLLVHNPFQNEESSNQPR